MRIRIMTLLVIHTLCMFFYESYPTMYSDDDGIKCGGVTYIFNFALFHTVGESRASLSHG